MPKCRLILGLLALGLLAALITAILYPREPSYKGRSLSHWLRSYTMSGLGAYDAERRADEALKNMGTNAIPYLLARLRTEDPPWTNKFYQLAEHLPEFIRPGRSIPLRYGVPGALAALGADARRAVPDLTKLAHDTNHLHTAEIATWCLGNILLEDMSPLLSLLTNANASIRATAWDAIRHQGTNAARVLPFLVQDYKADPRRFKALTLAALAAQSDLVVPALTNDLSNPKYQIRAAAATALETYGPQASSAVPAVITLLKDANCEVRNAATNTLRQIAPEALRTNTPPK